MSYLKATDENSNTYRFSLMPANDTTSKLFPAVKTVKVSTSNTLSFGSISYVSGRKYYVTVKFRTRGDGDSTSSKCSSVGFIANRSDWQNSYSYIHGSATAYAERGQIVEWTYEFTASASESRATALYFIINNGWANGYDNQTIDLFYYKMWDEQGNVYAESSSNVNLLKNDKWRDGKTLSEEETIDNYGVHGVLSSAIKWIRNHSYVLEFDLKLDADEINKDDFKVELDVGGYSYIFNTSILKNEIGYSYKHFRFIVRVSDYISPYYENILFGFSNYRVDESAGASDHKVYVKNISFKTYYDFSNFLKITKNNIIYYSKLFNLNDSSLNPKQLKLTKNNSDYYLAQNATEYKYNELASRTYQNLFEKFAY